MTSLQIKRKQVWELPSKRKAMVKAVAKEFVTLTYTNATLDERQTGSVYMSLPNMYRCKLLEDVNEL